MSDLVIRHCTLRVVRHGGWSWGPNRRAILANATAALPRLIAERLAELLADVDGEISQPIRLRLALRAGQLANGEGLASVVATGIRADMLPMVASGATPPIGGEAPTTAHAAANPLPTSAPRGATTYTDNRARVIDVLLRWRAQGVLWQRLQAFSRRSLDTWLSAMMRELPAAACAASIAEALQRDCTALAHNVPMRADDPASAQRARLAIAVELVARCDEAVDAQTLLSALDALIPLDRTQSFATKGVQAPVVANDAGGAADDDASRASTQHSVDAPRATSLARGEYRVELCSVLPYLVLGALHRLGWLDVMCATMRALDFPDRGSAFATALAYKLLPPADRGWHRTHIELQTAAAFAGLRVSPSPSELARWSRRASDALSPLDDLIVAELARCHDCSLPLLVMRVESRHELPWLLFDADGCFPVAWQRDETSVRRLVRRFGPCVVLVSAEAATPALVDGLVSDHRSVVTSATPARSDEWRRIKGTACWATGAPALPRRVLAATAMLPELMAHALAMTRELLHLRPAAPPREAAALEHCAALAAAAGLGSIATTLWRERETVHPLLALERFGNLDGIARMDGTVVEVVPAFGRRYLDLSKHGLCADIPAPPWMEARRIVFGGP